MNNTYKILIIVCTIFISNQLYSQEYYNASISYNIDKIKKDTINNNIFGGFTEFLNDYINGPMGLWAQEFQDRGFDYILSDTSKTSFHWQYWNKNKILDSIALDIEEKYNEFGRNSQLIKNISGNGKTGIRQRILISDTTTHTFYIYAKSNGISLNIQFLDTNETLLFEEKIFTTSDWKKYTLNIPKINKNNLYIYFSIDEIGTINIDESSLVPDNNEFGIRAEYADIFRKWKPSVIRFPGGSFVSNVGGVWWTGIGELDKRRSPLFYGPKPINQRMDMGYLEYVTFCEEFNLDPYIVSDYTRHTLQDHLNFLEYLLGDSNSVNGLLRKQHGRSKPCKIKYYEIGNEEWLEPIKYAKNFKLYYDTIKSIYPELIIIAAGNNWNGSTYIENQMDLIENSIDIYGWHPAKSDLVNPDLHDTLNYLSIVGLPEFAGDTELEMHYNTCKKYNNNSEFRIGITEWWSHYGNSETWTYDEHWRNNSLESGMWDIGMYLGYLKNPNLINLANRTIGMSWINRKVNNITKKKAIFPSVGLIGAIFLNSHRGNKSIPLEIESDIFNINEEKIAYHFETKYLDASSTFDGDSIYFYFINRSPNKSIRVNTDINSKFGENLKAKKYLLTSNYFLDHLTAENQNSIKFTDESVILNSEIVIEPYSFVTYSISNDVLSSVNNNNDKVKIKNSFIVQDILKLENSFEYVEIYNINGKLVYQSKLEYKQEFLDIRNLNDGYYSIILTSKKTKFPLRIFKMK